MEIHETTDVLVNLKDIDDRPGPYCMSFGFNLRLITQSIKRIGLVNSPFLIENGHGKLIIITGYRRIQALKSLGRDKTPCKILSKSDHSPLECLLLNLYDNIAIRKLNDVEKGMVLCRLENYINKTEILEQYMPLLDLPSHESTSLFFMKLEKELENDIKEYLVQGHLSLKIARMFLGMETEDRMRVFHLISSIKFNINQQGHLINFLTDLSRIHSISIQEILREHSFENIYSDTLLNNPQKAKALLYQLRVKRFPTLHQAEITFKNKILKLGLPKDIRINAPPYFEGPQYRLEILFKDGEELVGKIKSLSNIDDLKELKNPWEEEI